MMKTIAHSTLVILLLLGTAVGQNSLIGERDAWRTRADLLTGNLLKDAAREDPLARALIWAQLSDVWWESDQHQASAWIEKAVDAISYYPSDDAKTQNERFLQTAREVLKLISRHNNKQAARLSELLSKSEGLAEKEKNLNAGALIDQALAILKSNPEEAYALGLRAL